MISTSAVARGHHAHGQHKHTRDTHHVESPNIGVASWYGIAGGHKNKNGFHKFTSNGEHFDPLHSMTCAHKSIPFNTVLKVTDLSSGKVIFVRVNDRMPSGPHKLDLTIAAAKALGIYDKGIAKVEFDPVEVAEAR
jgi:rare lipoprotein A